MKNKTIRYTAAVVTTLVLLSVFGSSGTSNADTTTTADKASTASSAAIQAGTTAPAAAKTAPMEFAQQTVKISTGTKTVNVISIDPKDPRISFEVNLPGTLLDNTEDFENQVKAKKAKAAIDANFFSAYTEIKDPIGHVMVDGKLVYGQSGITSIGITKNRDILYGVPGIFTRMFADGKRTNDMHIGGLATYNVWVAYEVNTKSQSANNTVMYTPSRGASIDITAPGYVAIVRNKVLEDFYKVTPTVSVKIPRDGYVTFFGENVAAKWKGDNGLKKGRNIETEYYLFNSSGDTFDMNEMQWMLSGGPDLVIGGKPAPVSTHPAFTGTRFTTNSSPRTAIGTRKDGRLLLITVSGAKISELKEIMLKLGCENAINLDGGASCGMYYDGKTIMKPGRKLATILYVYEK